MTGPERRLMASLGEQLLAQEAAIAALERDLAAMQVRYTESISAFRRGLKESEAQVAALRGMLGRAVDKLEAIGVESEAMREFRAALAATPAVEASQ